MTAPALMPSQDVDQQQWQQLAANDPDYHLWLDLCDAENDRAFEAWLDTPEGQVWLDQQRASEDAQFFDWLDTPEGMAWLDSEAEAHLESQGLSHWNHDGFSPAVYA